MNRELSTDKPIDPITAFRENVAERIRKDIGDMMPDDMLRKICHDAVNNELYEKGGLPHSWIREEISQLIGRQVRETASTFITEQSGLVTELVEQAFKEQLPNLMARMFVEVMKGNSNALRFEIEQVIQSTRY